MSDRSRRTRRGFTLLELLLALTVTALVGAAISAMLSAVTTGVSTRQDNRSVMVRANAAANRLGAYVAPSRSMLAAGPTDLVVWFADSRESDTVHATEIRWLKFDAVENEMVVYYVQFPALWTQTAKDLADTEYVMTSDWDDVLATFEASGWVVSMPLVDGIDGVTITLNDANAMDAQQVSFLLDFQTTDGSIDVGVASTLVYHDPPSS